MRSRSWRSWCVPHSGRLPGRCRNSPAQNLRLSQVDAADAYGWPAAAGPLCPRRSIEAAIRAQKMNKYVLAALYVLALLSTGITFGRAGARRRTAAAAAACQHRDPPRQNDLGRSGNAGSPAGRELLWRTVRLDLCPRGWRSQVCGRVARWPSHCRIAAAFDRSVKRQPAWLTFFAVGDVAAAQRSVKANGGKTLSPPRDYPQRGRQAVFADPDGAVFAVLASSSGDPPDFMPEPGEWIWSSVLVKNADRETGFYRALFGYEVFDQPSDDTSRHVILASDDYARAGIHSLPNNLHRHAHWLNFVRVDDVRRHGGQGGAAGRKDPGRSAAGSTGRSAGRGRRSERCADRPHGMV